LNELFVVYEIGRFLCDEVAVVAILVLFNLQVGCIDGGILLEILLSAVLSLGRLGSTLFVQICVADVGLQLFEFVRFGTHLLDLTLASLVDNLKFRHFTC